MRYNGPTIAPVIFAAKDYFAAYDDKTQRHDSSFYAIFDEHHQDSSDREIRETCHSVTFYFMTKDSERCCDTTTPESIHAKDESKRGSAFAFIFGVN